MIFTKTKELLRIVSVLLISFTITAGISSCSHSFSGCYDISKYQVKQRKVDKSTGMAHYNPKKYKHPEPLQKKWIIGGSSPTVLGHGK